MKYSSDPKPFWITELMIVFVLGFALASALWLGVWFLHMRPAHAAAMDQRDQQLAYCQTARQQLHTQHEQVLAAKQQLDTELRDAKLGWGRCIRNQGQSAASNPDPLRNANP